MQSVARRGPKWGDHQRFLHALRAERGLLLIALAPMLLAALGIAGPPAPRWGLPAELGGAALVALGGLLLRVHHPTLGRLLALAGIGALLAALAPLVVLEPELAVFAGLAVWGLAHLVVDEPVLTVAALLPRPEPAATARTASLVVLAVWFTELLVGELGRVGPWPTLGALALATALSVRWALRDRSRPAVVFLFIALVAVAGAIALHASLPAALACLAAVPAATLVLAPRVGGGFVDRVIEHPARLLVVTFMGLCALGTVALAVPAVAASGQSVGILDALFTSTSAVCVTGLIVLDTPNAFSFAGQLGIVVLIQVGGLGIMTFYTVALAALGRRLSLRHERAVAGAVNVEDRRRLVGSLRRVLVLTGVSELLGALALFGAFLYEASLRGERLTDAVGVEAWRAVFTSISAFCNAGFALQTDSLIPYQHNPVVLYTVMALIVVGGLSPAAVVMIPRWVRREPVPLQQRLMLGMAAVLLVSGAVLYGGLEWSASLGGLGWPDRVNNAIFQSVTLRTAGFNSVDLTQTRPATQTLMIMFMLIGGSPGGTAGGMKTTTLAVVLAMLAATLRGRDQAEAYGRQLGRTTIFKAAAVVTVGVAALLVGLLAVQLTQAIELELAAFEVASALGTVGLSLGATGMLDAVGKIIVIGCMFAGRVGPLTLFLFLSEQHHEVAISYPEEEVDVG